MTACVMAPRGCTSEASGPEIERMLAGLGWQLVPAVGTRLSVPSAWAFHELRRTLTCVLGGAGKTLRAQLVPAPPASCIVIGEVPTAVYLAAEAGRWDVNEGPLAHAGRWACSECCLWLAVSGFTEVMPTDPIENIECSGCRTTRLVNRDRLLDHPEGRSAELARVGLFEPERVDGPGGWDFGAPAYVCSMTCQEVYQHEGRRVR
jgi:hypothetical protein